MHFRCSEFATVLAAAALATFLGGCGRQGGFIDADRELLSTLTLTAENKPPPSPSNAYADHPDAAIAAAVAKLGQRFYFDTRFSGPLVVASYLGNPGESGKVACATCHDPELGGTDNGSRANTSVAANWTGRNAPTVYNVAYNTGWLFWDGRRDSVWSQALGPPESDAEHNGTRLQFAHLINNDPTYNFEYQRLFGNFTINFASLPATGKPGDSQWEALPPATKTAINRISANFGKAIEAYERTLIDRNSPFDRWMAGEESAMSAAAIRGARLFVGKASCIECHNGPTLSDGKFHNLGVQQVGPALPAEDRGRTGGIPGVLANEFNRAGPYSDKTDNAHLAELAPTTRDLGAFKTPPLRSISRTGPYMHTGTFETLRDVINFYRYGGGTSGYVGNKDASIKPLYLTDAEVEDLVAFMHALDGERLPSNLVNPIP